MTKQKYIKYLVISSFVMTLTFFVFAGDVFADVQSINNSTLRAMEVGQIARETGLSYTPIKDIIFKTIVVVSEVVGGLAVLVLLFGGIMYIVSAGDSTKIDTAKSIILYSIIGLIVALLAWVIVNAIITNLSS